MSVDDPQAPEELFASSLAAYHEGLATDSTLTFAPDTPTDLNAESVERLKRAQECVRLLSRLWPQPELAAEVAQFLAMPSETSQLQVTPSRLGRFQIVSKLGRGAFGIVFLAIDPALGRRIALKLPRPETRLSRSTLQTPDTLRLKCRSRSALQGRRLRIA